MHAVQVNDWLHMRFLLRCHGLSHSQLAASSKGSLTFYNFVRMASTTRAPRDPNTLSNYNNFLTTHTTANLTIDFEQKKLKGNVTLNLKSITDAATREILLDTSHLDVNDVKIDGRALKWSLIPFEPYGSALKIELERGVPNEKSVDVDVRPYYVSGR